MADPERREILPDSRAHAPTGVIRGPWGNWVPIFCANCGTRGGYVPEENCTFVFWLCDKCYETHGHIAGTMAVPDELFWARVRAEQEEKRRAAEAERLPIIGSG